MPIRAEVRFPWLLIVDYCFSICYDIISLKYVYEGNDEQMANDGNIFRDKLKELIKSWEPEDLEVETEKHVGLRFVNTPRKLDIIVH